MRDKRLNVFWISLVVMATGILMYVAPAELKPARVNAQQTPVAYDVSSYQGNITGDQANQLKNEVKFMILKAQNGGLYQDPTFSNNAQMLEDNGVPYGVYDYSVYGNESQARAEADALRLRAPNAAFYVNDAEENDAGSDFDNATHAWADEMHQVTNKPAILYSDLYFMNNNISQPTRDAYNTLWVAAYGPEPNPNYHYDLWQYTNHQYSNALGQYVDASTFPDGEAEPLSFWTNGESVNSSNGGSDNNGNGNNDNNNGNNNVVINNNDNGGDDDGDDIIFPSSYKPRKPSRPVVIPVTPKKRRPVKPRARRQRPVRPVVKPQRPRWRRSQVRRGYVRYNPHYYRSRNVKYLKVINPNGIDLYWANGKPIGRINRGMVLAVSRFETIRHPYGAATTEAVGIHWGAPDYFTSNKSDVRWDY